MGWGCRCERWRVGRCVSRKSGKIFAGGPQLFYFLLPVRLWVPYHSKGGTSGNLFIWLLGLNGARIVINKGCKVSGVWGANSHVIPSAVNTKVDLYRQDVEAIMGRLYKWVNRPRAKGGKNFRGFCQYIPKLKKIDQNFNTPTCGPFWRTRGGDPVQSHGGIYGKVKRWASRHS